MEKDPEQLDPEAENREQPNDGAEGGAGNDDTQPFQPVDGPGGAEDGQGATSQDSPAP